MCKAEITQKVNCTVYDGIQIQGYIRCQLEDIQRLCPKL